MSTPQKSIEESKETVLAICYDFDKTLTPDDMQAQGYIQSVGYDVKEFWDESNKLAKANNMDQNLAYMLKMKEEAEGRIVFSRETLQEYGSKIKLFPGVEGWFDRTKQLGKSFGIKVEHYIISSGLKEMIEGTSLAKRNVFERIYASSFHYNEKGVAIWPAQIVNFTNKTQFLFRIEKGCLDINDDAVNDYIPPEKMRVPFRNIVYIGDSDTDIPCMKLVNSSGGFSIGVYNPETGVKDKVLQMARENRINYFCSADYSEGTELDQLISTIIRFVAVRSKLEKESFKCLTEARLDKKDRDFAAGINDINQIRIRRKMDWNGLMNNPKLFASFVAPSYPMKQFQEALNALMKDVQNPIDQLTKIPLPNLSFSIPYPRPPRKENEDKQK